MIFDRDAPQLTKGGWVEEAEGGGAVGEDKTFAVLGEPPTLACVGEGVEEVEGDAVINQRDVALPCELNKSAAPLGEAFGKVLAGNVLELEDAAGFKILHAQGGVTFKAGAFVEMAVGVDESLGKGLLVVRICVNDLVGVGLDGVRERWGERCG